MEKTILRVVKNKHNRLVWKIIRCDSDPSVVGEITACGTPYPAYACVVGSEYETAYYLPKELRKTVQRKSPVKPMRKITDKDINYLWKAVLGRHKSPEVVFKDLPPKKLLRTFIVAWELGRDVKNIKERKTK